MRGRLFQESYGSPDVLELREIEQPVPGPREVLVKERVASVNTAEVPDALRFVEQGHAREEVVMPCQAAPLARPEHRQRQWPER